MERAANSAKAVAVVAASVKPSQFCLTSLKQYEASISPLAGRRRLVAQEDQVLEHVLVQRPVLGSSLLNSRVHTRSKSSPRPVSDALADVLHRNPALKQHRRLKVAKVVEPHVIESQ